MGEIELRNVGRVRVCIDLLVGGIANVELDVISGLDLERRLDRVVPHVVERVGPQVVQRAMRVLHGRFLHHQWTICQTL